ncbi:hypothetical protein FRC05_002348 [Tulasnella sp. 425]|nr:hypothetical protein FRC05_002348 [Tulasnella sp. 425]
MASIPSTQRALVVAEGGQLGVKSDFAVPKINDEEILIKVVAVTTNPTDWKHATRALKPGDALGCDFAGDVVQVGKNVTSIKVGDAVAGFIRGGYMESGNGSFQEYMKADPTLVWVIPKSEVPYEDASSMGGIALSTAAYALVGPLGLPSPWAPAKEPTTVLIWAGTTSVGIYAIAVAKLAGLKVVTTASPRHFEFVKKLGADAVFDYRDPETPAKIKAWSNGQIKHALDCISEHGTTKLAADSMSNDGGRIIIIIPVKRDESFPPSNIETHEILIYHGLKHDRDDYYPVLTEWLKHMPEIAPKLKVMPLKRWPGGLDALPEALAYHMAGKLSAEKIVVNV